MQTLKVETMDKREQFLEDIKNSENDILNGRVHKIDDVDKYIEELKNAID